MPKIARFHTGRYVHPLARLLYASVLLGIRAKNDVLASANAFGNAAVNGLAESAATLLVDATICSIC